jgi:hypothetical protein
MSHGPLFFRRSPWEEMDFIPAIDWDTRQRIDPNRRDSQLGPVIRSDCQASRPRWSFNTTDGELHSRGYMNSVETSEVNGALQAAWDRYGKETVLRIVLHLDPRSVENSFHLLQRCGFERATAREGGIPELVFVGPPLPMKWK